MNRFGYCRDRLFQIGVLAYAANRWLVRPRVANGFIHGQFNDLWLIPCALPPMLWVHRRLGWRHGDHPPSAVEVAFHAAVWSVVAEMVGPRLFRRAVGDPWDVAAYVAGGFAAWIWWNRTRTTASAISTGEAK